MKYLQRFKNPLYKKPLFQVHMCPGVDSEWRIEVLILLTFYLSCLHVNCLEKFEFVLETNADLVVCNLELRTLKVYAIQIQNNSYFWVYGNLKICPHLPLLFTQNKTNNEIKRIPHWAFGPGYANLIFIFFQPKNRTLIKSGDLQHCQSRKILSLQNLPHYQCPDLQI